MSATPRALPSGLVEALDPSNTPLVLNVTKKDLVDDTKSKLQMINAIKSGRNAGANGDPIIGTTVTAPSGPTPGAKEVEGSKATANLVKLASMSKGFGKPSLLGTSLDLGKGSSHSNPLGTESNLLNKVSTDTKKKMFEGFGSMKDVKLNDVGRTASARNLVEGMMKLSDVGRAASARNIVDGLRNGAIPTSSCHSGSVSKGVSRESSMYESFGGMKDVKLNELARTPSARNIVEGLMSGAIPTSSSHHAAAKSRELVRENSINDLELLQVSDEEFSDEESDASFGVDSECEEESEEEDDEEGVLGPNLDDEDFEETALQATACTRPRADSQRLQKAGNSSRRRSTMNRRNNSSCGGSSSRLGGSNSRLPGGSSSKLNAGAPRPKPSARRGTRKPRAGLEGSYGNVNDAGKQRRRVRSKNNSSGSLSANPDHCVDAGGPKRRSDRAREGMEGSFDKGPFENAAPARSRASTREPAGNEPSRPRLGPKVPKEEDAKGARRSVIVVSSGAEPRRKPDTVRAEDITNTKASRFGKDRSRKEAADKKRASQGRRASEMVVGRAHGSLLDRVGTGPPK